VAEAGNFHVREPSLRASRDVLVFRETVFLTATAAAIAGTFRGQDLAPAFEVAAIRPTGADSGPISIRRLAGGRLVTSSTSLSMLVLWAFDLDEGRVAGMPKGADAARFDITAQAPTASPAAGQMQLMMRALLGERFGLAFHREIRDLTAYSLTVEEGGPRVTITVPAQPAGPDPFLMTTPGILTGRAVTTQMLAMALSSQLGRPVRNATNVSGSFDFRLAWQTEELLAPDNASASLFTAIREQLGFRLVAGKAPVEVIVLDALSLTPTAN
jgi:uncharacterized protein (TIGR03435 family)